MGYITPPQNFNNIVLQFGLACSDRPELHYSVVNIKFRQAQVILQARWSTVLQSKAAAGARLGLPRAPASPAPPAAAAAHGELRAPPNLQTEHRRAGLH